MVAIPANKSCREDDEVARLATLIADAYRCRFPPYALSEEDQIFFARAILLGSVESASKKQS